MERKRILIASDTHLCHVNWYGIPAGERMERFIRDVEEEYDRDPFEELVLLGDYSLDHWKWQVKGSWLREGLSYTDIFVKNYLSRLARYPFRVCMTAGNHEQYGDALYQRFTGRHRQSHFVTGNTLFVLLDTYGADLDPTEHSDGTYAGTDVQYVRQLMDYYPDTRVILCAHYFDPAREGEDFRALLRDQRVICLFAGHNHLSHVRELGEEYGCKKLIFTGHYSYVGGKKPIGECMWGFRELILTDGGLETSYITPANSLYPTEGAELTAYPRGVQDRAVIVSD